MLLIAVSTLFPLIWVYLGTMKTTQEIFAFPPTIFPKHWSLSNFIAGWNALRFPHFFKNTFILAFGIWLSSMTVTILAAYSLAKLNPLFKKILLFLFLSTLMVPMLSYMIPMYLVLKQFTFVNPEHGLLDSYWAFWLPAGANAFNIYILKGFFAEVPESLLDAARIDGAGEMRILTTIILPLSRPVIATLTIFTFTGVWNDFIWPYIILTTTDIQPIMVALYKNVFSSDLFQWNVILAAMAITSLPPIILFLFFQKQIIRGVNLVGIKG